MSGDISPENQAAAPQFLSGRRHLYPSDVERAGLTIVYDRPAQRAGKVRLSAYGGTQNGTCTVVRYTRAGDTFTAVGTNATVDLVAGEYKEFDTGIDIEVGEYVGLSYPLGAVSYTNTGQSEQKEGYFIGNTTSFAAGTRQTTTDFMFRFDIFPKFLKVSGDHQVLWLGDSLSTPEATRPIARHFERAIGMKVANAAIGGTGISAQERFAGDDFALVSATKVLQALASGTWTEFDTAVDDLLAAGGSGTDATAQRDLLQSLDMSKMQAVVIFSGTNDYGNSKAIGTAADTVDTTLRGAINNGVSDLLAAFPHLKILFVTPIYRDRFNAGDGNDSDTYENSAGFVLRDYCAAIQDQAAKLHCPSLNLYDESGIGPHNASEIMSDGLHVSSYKSSVKLGIQVGRWARQYLED